MKSTLAMILASALLAACGGGGNDDDTTPDQPPINLVDAAVPQPDAPPAVDAGPVECTATADYGSPGALAGEAQADSAGTPTEMIFDAPLNMDPAFDILSVQLFADYGLFSGSGIVPGTYQIAGDELNYKTCGLCVLVYTNIDAEGKATDIYLATGGTVTITSVTPNLTGSLADVTFEHVTIAPRPDFTSTPVGDGCISAMTGVTFDSMVTVPPPM